MPVLKVYRKAMMKINYGVAAGLMALTSLCVFFSVSQASAEADMTLSDCIRLTSLDKECHTAFEKGSGDSWARIANNFIIRYDAGNRVNGEMFSHIVYAFRKAAENGNPSGLFYMSQLYQVGKGRDLPRDEGKAWGYLDEAAGKGHSRAMALRGFLQYQVFSDYYPSDTGPALEYLKKAAEKGEPFSENIMGILLYNGAGMDRSPERAFEWFGRAASHGYAPAVNNLGFMYENGIGTAKDPEMAFKMYERAASKDLREGILNLGRAYLYGIGVKTDYLKAFPYIERAAERKLPDAMYLAGWMLHSGYGTNADLPRGFRYLDRAAQEGNLPAIGLMAEMYEKGEGVSCQPEKARELRENIKDSGWYNYSDSQMVPAVMSLPSGFRFR